MKDTLKKDINVLGRSIPVFVIALLLVGGAAASGALLTSFGTVEGTAETQQAVTLDGADGDNEISEVFDEDDIYAGQTWVDTYTLESQTEVDVNVGFQTTLSDKDNENFDEETATSYRHVWEEHEELDYEFATDVVNTFSDAGADYEGAPNAEHTISETGDITLSDEDTVEDGDVVVVESDLDTLTVDVENVEVHSDDATVGHITIESDGVEVAGFTVTTDEEEGNGITLSNPLDDVVVRDNTMEDLERGIIVTGTKAQEDYPVDAEVKNNDFIDNHVGISQASSDDLEIRDNVFEGNSLEGVGSVPDYGQPTIEHNHFKDNEASVQAYVEGTLTAHDNFFADGFNTATDSEDAEVEASYQSLDETVTVEDETEFGIVHEFPINLPGDDYTFTTEVQPVAQSASAE